MGAGRIWRWALLVAACAVPVTGAAAFAAGPAAPAVAPTVVPSSTTVPATDLGVTAGTGDGAVGDQIDILLHLRNYGPQEAPAGSVVEEYKAPAGAKLLGTHAPGATTVVPFGGNCAWVTPGTDVRCVHQKAMAAHRIGPFGNEDNPRYLVIQVISKITARGSYHANCHAGACDDWLLVNNTVPIIVNGVSAAPSASPSVKPTATPTPTATATPTRTPSHSPTATRRSATPSVSATPTDTVGGIDPSDDSSAPAVAGPPSRGDGGGLGLTAIVWTVLGAALVVAAGIAVLLVRRREPVPVDLDEDTDDLGGLYGRP